jgi:CSLREA domain-containing protein
MHKRIVHLLLVGILGFLVLPPFANVTAFDPDPMEFWVNDFRDLADNANNSVCDGTDPQDNQYPCTLRAAIYEANKCTPAACGDYVTIHVPSGTYNLTIPGANENLNQTGDLDVMSEFAVPIIIEGDPVNPPIINANGIDRVFHVLSNSSNTNITLRYLVIQGGHLEINTPASQTYQYGGGIANSGNLILENVVIQDNQLTCVSTNDINCYQAIGGGLFNSGVLSMNMSTIRNNLAARGGGIFHNNTITMSQIFHSTISGNQGIQSGGGLESYGLLYFINSTISNNSAPFYGGIGNEGSGDLTLLNVTIASNISTNSNAANLINNASLTIMNSVIAYPGNLPTAVNCFNGGSWTMDGGNLYSDGSCIAGSGVISNVDPKLSPLAWLGGPTMTRGLLKGSPAHDVGVNFCLDLTGGTVTIDQRGQNRDSKCDLGAFEGVGYQIFLPIIKH